MTFRKAKRVAQLNTKSETLIAVSKEYSRQSFAALKPKAHIIKQGSKIYTKGTENFEQKGENPIITLHKEVEKILSSLTAENFEEKISHITELIQTAKNEMIINEGGPESNFFKQLITLLQSKTFSEKSLDEFAATIKEKFNIDITDKSFQQNLIKETKDEINSAVEDKKHLNQFKVDLLAIFTDTESTSKDKINNIDIIKDIKYVKEHTDQDNKKVPAAFEITMTTQRGASNVAAFFTLGLVGELKTFFNTRANTLVSHANDNLGNKPNPKIVETMEKLLRQASKYAVGYNKLDKDTQDYRNKALTEDLQKIIDGEPPPEPRLSRPLQEEKLQTESSVMDEKNDAISPREKSIKEDNISKQPQPKVTEEKIESPISKSISKDDSFLSSTTEDIKQKETRKTRRSASVGSAPNTAQEDASTKKNPGSSTSKNQEELESTIKQNDAAIKELSDQIRILKKAEPQTNSEIKEEGEEKQRKQETIITALDSEKKEIFEKMSTEIDKQSKSVKGHQDVKDKQEKLDKIKEKIEAEEKKSSQLSGQDTIPFQENSPTEKPTLMRKIHTTSMPEITKNGYTAIQSTADAQAYREFHDDVMDNYTVDKASADLSDKIISAEKHLEHIKSENLKLRAENILKQIPEEKIDLITNARNELLEFTKIPTTSEALDEIINENLKSIKNKTVHNNTEIEIYTDFLETKSDKTPTQEAMLDVLKTLKAPHNKKTPDDNLVEYSNYLVEQVKALEKYNKLNQLNAELDRKWETLSDQEKDVLSNTFKEIEEDSIKIILNDPSDKNAIEEQLKLLDKTISEKRKELADENAKSTANDLAQKLSTRPSPADEKESSSPKTDAILEKIVKDLTAAGGSDKTTPEAVDQIVSNGNSELDQHIQEQQEQQVKAKAMLTTIEEEQKNTPDDHSKTSEYLNAAKTAAENAAKSFTPNASKTPAEQLLDRAAHARDQEKQLSEAELNLERAKLHENAATLAGKLSQLEAEIKGINPRTKEDQQELKRISDQRDKIATETEKIIQEAASGKVKIPDAAAQLEEQSKKLEKLNEEFKTFSEQQTLWETIDKNNKLIQNISDNEIKPKLRNISKLEEKEETSLKEIEGWPHRDATKETLEKYISAQTSHLKDLNNVKTLVGQAFELNNKLDEIERKLKKGPIIDSELTKTREALKSTVERSAKTLKAENLDDISKKIKNLETRINEELAMAIHQKIAAATVKDFATLVIITTAATPTMNEEKAVEEKDAVQSQLESGTRVDRTKRALIDWSNKVILGSQRVISDAELQIVTKDYIDNLLLKMTREKVIALFPERIKDLPFAQLKEILIAPDLEAVRLAVSQHLGLNPAAIIPNDATAKQVREFAQTRMLALTPQELISSGALQSLGRDDLTKILDARNMKEFHEALIPGLFENVNQAKLLFPGDDTATLDANATKFKTAAAMTYKANFLSEDIKNQNPNIRMDFKSTARIAAATTNQTMVAALSEEKPQVYTPQMAQAVVEAKIDHEININAIAATQALRFLLSDESPINELTLDQLRVLTNTPLGTKDSVMQKALQNHNGGIELTENQAKAIIRNRDDVDRVRNRCAVRLREPDVLPAACATLNFEQAKAVAECKLDDFDTMQSLLQGDPFRLSKDAAGRVASNDFGGRDFINEMRARADVILSPFFRDTAIHAVNAKSFNDRAHLEPLVAANGAAVANGAALVAIRANPDRFGLTQAEANKLSEAHAGEIATAAATRSNVLFKDEAIRVVNAKVFNDRAHLEPLVPVPPVPALLGPAAKDQIVANFANFGLTENEARKLSDDHALAVATRATEKSSELFLNEAKRVIGTKTFAERAQLIPLVPAPPTVFTGPQARNVIIANYANLGLTENEARKLSDEHALNIADENTAKLRVLLNLECGNLNFPQAKAIATATTVDEMRAALGPAPGGAGLLTAAEANAVITDPAHLAPLKTAAAARLRTALPDLTFEQAKALAECKAGNDGVGEVQTILQKPPFGLSSAIAKQVVPDAGINAGNHVNAMRQGAAEKIRNGLFPPLTLDQAKVIANVAVDGHIAMRAALALPPFNLSPEAQQLVCHDAAAANTLRQKGADLAVFMHLKARIGTGAIDAAINELSNAGAAPAGIQNIFNNPTHKTNLGLNNTLVADAALLNRAIANLSPDQLLELQRDAAARMRPSNVLLSDINICLARVQREREMFPGGIDRFDKPPLRAKIAQLEAAKNAIEQENAGHAPPDILTHKQNAMQILDNEFFISQKAHDDHTRAHYADYAAAHPHDPAPPPSPPPLKTTIFYPRECPTNISEGELIEARSATFSKVKMEQLYKNLLITYENAEFDALAHQQIKDDLAGVMEVIRTLQAAKNTGGDPAWLDPMIAAYQQLAFAMKERGEQTFKLIYDPLQRSYGASEKLEPDEYKEYLKTIGIISPAGGVPGAPERGVVASVTPNPPTRDVRFELNKHYIHPPRVRNAAGGFDPPDPAKSVVAVHATPKRTEHILLKLPDSISEPKLLNDFIRIECKFAVKDEPRFKAALHALGPVITRDALIHFLDDIRKENIVGFKLGFDTAFADDFMKYKDNHRTAQFSYPGKGLPWGDSHGKWQGGPGSVTLPNKAMLKAAAEFLNSHITTGHVPARIEPGADPMFVLACKLVLHANDFHADNKLKFSDQFILPTQPQPTESQLEAVTHLVYESKLGKVSGGDKMEIILSSGVESAKQLKRDVDMMGRANSETAQRSVEKDKQEGLHGVRNPLDPNASGFGVDKGDLEQKRDGGTPRRP
ncbi:MAG: hypothetical protein SFW66_10995 [Gammaproteobacteria bacterium]|nr:hypothetical protein [Gammaproteobacteria bacterium]